MLTRDAASPLAPFEAAVGQIFFGSRKTPSKVKGEGVTSSNGSSVCDQPSEQHHEGAKKKQAKKTEWLTLNPCDGHEDVCLPD